MTPIVVGIGDCAVTTNPEAELITYALGSCIAVAAIDRTVPVAGLLHFMLPEAALDAQLARLHPHRFADTGIPRLLEQLLAAGAHKRRLLIALIGGAQTMEDPGLFQIGKRNYLAARKLLWKAGFLIAAEAVGGAVSRTVRLEVAGGRLSVQEAGHSYRELLAACHLSAAAKVL